MNALDFCEDTREYRTRAADVIGEMIQFVALQGAPMLDSAQPIMAIVDNFR